MVAAGSGVFIYTKRLFLALSLACLYGCFDGEDRDQVQVIQEGEAFREFQHPPRDIRYGPYSLGVTTNSAVIAWEERQGFDGLRHVEVELTGLQPATRYQYLVNGSSSDGKFVTPPLDTDNESSFSFFVWGDTRTGNEESGHIIEEMLSRAPGAAFALHTGDMVEDGDLLEDWEQHWWTPMRPLLSAMPVYPTMGNHEINSEWYQRYFASLGGGGMNYSFDWGRVHFVVLDDNRINFGGSEQLDWLEADLQAHMDADFTVVCHHIPVYFSSPGHTRGVSGMDYLQDTLPAIYERNGVDLVLSGDVHSFQHHVKNNVHYLISAGGGEKPYEPGLPLDNMTLALASSYHYAVGRISGRALHMGVYDPDGNVLDDFELFPETTTEITTGVNVVCDYETAGRGQSLAVDIYLTDVSDLEQASFQLDYFKSDPSLMLIATDQDTLQSGNQAEPGDLGGSILLNLADNDVGMLSYTETDLNGLTTSRVRVATLHATIPEDARITAMYFVPRFSLIDLFGGTIPVFLGGTKVVISP